MANTTNTLTADDCYDHFKSVCTYFEDERGLGDINEEQLQCICDTVRLAYMKLNIS
jgi:hypothetical protein